MRITKINTTLSPRQEKAIFRHFVSRVGAVREARRAESGASRGEVWGLPPLLGARTKTVTPQERGEGGKKKNIDLETRVLKSITKCALKVDKTRGWTRCISRVLEGVITATAEQTTHPKARGLVSFRGGGRGERGQITLVTGWEREQCPEDRQNKSLTIHRHICVLEGVTSDDPGAGITYSLGCFSKGAGRG